MKKFAWSSNYENIDVDSFDLLRRIKKRLHYRKSLFSCFEKHLPLDGSKTFGDPPKVLEVGCGMGIESGILASLGYKVFGVDSEVSALDYSRRVRKLLNNQIHLEKGDAFALEFSDESFDMVYSQGFMEHFSDEDVVKLVKEQFRVLKQGGILLIDVPSKYSFYHIYKSRFTLLGEEKWFFGFERSFSLKQLKNFISTARPTSKYIDKYSWSSLGYPYRSLFDLIFMGGLVVPRMLLSPFGVGADCIGVLFRKC